MRLKILLFSFIIIAAGGMASSDTFTPDTVDSDAVDADTEAPYTVVPDTEAPDTVVPDTVAIVAVGDIMMGTIIPDGKHLPPNNDCSPQLKELISILSGGDITFGNLEGVLTDVKTGAKKCNDPSVCYTFGMPTHFANCLADAGFNLLSIANNHVGDFGEQGRKSTVETLKKSGIRFAGLLDYVITEQFIINGIKYGFCAFAPNTGALNIKDIPAAEKIVRELAETSDVVIVSFHGGGEGKAYRNITRKTETFLGEDRGNVYEFAHRMIDAGADLLLGHGPHITRAVEVYKGRFIAYSMGNFCTYDRININGENGLAPVFKIYTDNKGEFLKAEIYPVYQEKFQPVRIDPQKRVIKIIQELTKADFPEMDSVIEITDDGLILLK